MYKNPIMVLLAFFCFSGPCWTKDSSALKSPRILYINSYPQGYTWSDRILDGIRETFALDSALFSISPFPLTRVVKCPFISEGGSFQECSRREKF